MVNKSISALSLILCLVAQTIGAQESDGVATTIYSTDFRFYNVYGKSLDGRVYSSTRGQATDTSIKNPGMAFSMNPDATDFRYFALNGVNPVGEAVSVLNEASVNANFGNMKSLETVPFDSAGRIYKGSWPIQQGTNPDGSEYGPTLSGMCPSIQQYRSAIGVPYVTVGKFYGSLFWFNDRHEPVKIPATENLCPVGPIVVDGEDNIYFFSIMGLNYGGADELGQRLYKLSADHQTLTLLHHFSQGAFWESDSNYRNTAPVAMIMDGEWLYGLFGPNATASIPARLFKIKNDGTGLQVLQEFTASVLPVDTSGSFSEKVLVDGGDFIYGNIDAYVYRIRKDGSDLSFIHRGVGGINIYGTLAVTSLLMGQDGNLYVAQLGASGIAGSVGRIVLDAAQGTGAYESLWPYSEGGRSPALLFASGNKIYGTDYQSYYASQRLFTLDAGTTSPAPQIYLWSDYPEVSPGEDGSLPANAVHWRVENLGSGTCSSEWAGSGLAAEGQAGVEVSQSGRNVYTLTCDNGTASSSRSISIYSSAAPVAAEIVSFSASAASVQMNQSVTLSWQVSNALTCTGSGEDTWSGAKSFDADGKGSQTLTVAEKSAAYDASYVLTCKGGGGNDSRTVTVAVSTPPGTVAHSGGALAWLLLPLALAAGLRQRGRQGWLI